MVDAKLQKDRQDDSRLTVQKRVVSCVAFFCSRDKLESQARFAHKGVSALIWRKKRRKKQDRRREGEGGVISSYIFREVFCINLI